MNKFFPNCDNSPGGKIYLKGVTVIPKYNIISKETLFQTKVNTNLTHTRDTNTAIKLFVKPIMGQTADMRKVKNSGDRDHLGQM